MSAWLVQHECYNVGQSLYKSSTVPLMLELCIKFLLSYFIGSIMGSMVMGKLRGGIDEFAPLAVRFVRHIQIQP